jgi:low affinity Fe/Cu permease
VLIVGVWLVSGPVVHFSDTWQLVINTGTTILTFLMVFLVQNTLDRDAIAVHLKLDELIRVTEQARNALIGSERLPVKVLEALEAQDPPPVVDE